MSKRKFTSSIAVVVVICLAAVFVFDCFAQSDPAADIHSGPRVLEVSSIGCGIGPDPENTNCGAAGLVSVILSNNHGGLVAPGQTPAQAIPFVSQWVFSTAKVNGPAHEAPYSALELFYAYNAIVTQFSPGECVEVKRVGVQADDGSWPPMTDTPSVKETNLSGVHISHVLGKYPGVEDFIDAFDNGASISVSIHTYGDPSNQVVGYHALRLGSVHGTPDIQYEPDGVTVASISYLGSFYDPLTDKTLDIPIVITKDLNGKALLSVKYNDGVSNFTWYIVDFYSAKKVPCSPTTPSGGPPASVTGTGTGAGHGAPPVMTPPLTGGGASFSCNDPNNGFDKSVNQANQCKDNCPPDTDQFTWECTGDCTCKKTLKEILPPSH